MMIKQTQTGEIKIPKQLVPLSDVLGELSDVDNASDKLLALCIGRPVHAYIAVPPGHVVIEHPYAIIKKPTMADAVLRGDHRPTASNISRTALRRSVSFLRLSNFDLRQLRASGAVVVGEFYEGGLSQFMNGYGGYKLNHSVLVNGSFPHLSDGQPVYLEPTRNKGVGIGLNDVFLDARIKGHALELLAEMTSSAHVIEDRYGHRVKAPAVLALYQAAKLHAGDKYNEEEIRKLLGSYTPKGIFNGKTLDYAVKMVKKGSTRVPQEKDKDGSFEKALLDNGPDGSYLDDDLSRRVRLFLLATDCWIHRLQCERPHKSKSGPLDKILIDLGFTSVENTRVKKGEKRAPNPNESQVEYLKRIILNVAK